MAEVIHTRQGAGAPTTPPDSINQHYIDTTGSSYIYFAKGTTSVADWVKVATGDRPDPIEVPTPASAADIIEGTNNTDFTTPAGLKAAGIVPGGDGGGGGGGASLSIGQVVTTIGELSNPSMIDVTQGADVDITNRSYGEDLLDPVRDLAAPVYRIVPGFTAVSQVAFGDRAILVLGDRDGSLKLHLSTDSAETWTVVPAPANHTWHYLGATNRGGNGDYLVVVAAGNDGSSQIHLLHAYNGTWSTPMVGPPDFDSQAETIVGITGDADGLVLITEYDIYKNSNYDYDGDIEGAHWETINLATEFPEHQYDRMVDIYRYQSGYYHIGVSDGTILALTYSGGLSVVSESGGDGPTSIYSLHFDSDNNRLLVLGDSSIRPMWVTSTWSTPFSGWETVSAADGNTISPDVILVGYDGFRLFAESEPMYLLGAYANTYSPKGITPELYVITSHAKAAGTGAPSSTYLPIEDENWQGLLISDRYVEGSIGVPRYPTPEGYKTYMYLPTDS